MQREKENEEEGEEWLKSCGFLLVSHACGIKAGKLSLA